MTNSVPKTAVTIRDLETIADIAGVLRLEKEVWGFEDADVTPLTLAVAMKAAGTIRIRLLCGLRTVGVVSDIN